MCGRTCLDAQGHDQQEPSQTDGRYSRTRKSLGRRVFHPRHESSLRGCFSKPQSEVQHVQGWQSPNDKVGHSVAEYDGARSVFSQVLATRGDRRNLEEIRRIPPTPRPKTTHGHRGGSGCRPLSIPFGRCGRAPPPAAAGGNTKRIRLSGGRVVSVNTSRALDSLCQRNLDTPDVTVDCHAVRLERILCRALQHGSRAHVEPRAVPWAGHG